MHLTTLALNLIVPDKQDLALNSVSRAALNVALQRGCVGLSRPTPTLHNLSCYLQQSSTPGMAQSFRTHIACISFNSRPGAYCTAREGNGGMAQR